jgi:N-acetyl-gamma-glutamyl-phosphate reductase
MTIESVRVGVVGFTGYSGAELCAILQRHPRVAVTLLEHRTSAEDPAASPDPPRTARRPLDHPLGGLPRRPFSIAELRAADARVVFLATPPEVSMALAPQALDAGARVVDLSGAFRLRTVEAYKRWYGADHDRPDLLKEAAYGLPELFREATRRASLVANPGCYPTAAGLALRPLVARGVVDRAAGVVCDAKSGVTGAGKAPTQKTHFCSVGENFSAYGVLRHKHVPEVLLSSGLEERELSFTAQLLPVRRGILETLYLRTTVDMSRDEIAQIYEDAYGEEPFIRLYPKGSFPQLDSVTHTNYCDIGIEVDPATRRVVLVVAIDNLVKGAAGQAVQNMNLLLDFPETLALL